MVQKIHLNPSLDIRMMMSLDHVQSLFTYVKLPQMIGYVKCLDSNKTCLIIITVIKYVFQGH